MAKYLRSSGKRSEAFPCDWLISSLKYVNYICKTRDYDKIMNIMFNINESNIKTRNKKNLIVKYRCPELAKIEFYHDFYSFNTVLGQLENVKDKYLRRIKRFHNFINIVQVNKFVSKNLRKMLNSKNSIIRRIFGNGSWMFRYYFVYC